MEAKHGKQADAIYIYLPDNPYAHGKDLDDERRIDYDSDDVPVGIELLCVSQGVNLDSLPYADEVSAILKARGIRAYRTVKHPHSLKVSTPPQTG